MVQLFDQNTSEPIARALLGSKTNGESDMKQEEGSRCETPVLTGEHAFGESEEEDENNAAEGM